MNYPFWDIPLLGGSMLIAIIAVLHVIVSHLAIGGGFYLYFAERKYAREKDPKFLGYIRSHARFFMLLTTVFGAVSGVGIWFVIALVSPAATSTLIHIFLYGWAIEWVFFLVEILAIILYVYKFDKLEPASREKLAFIYMAAAWLSLFIINGIITFMLTPVHYKRHHHIHAHARRLLPDRQLLVGLFQPDLLAVAFLPHRRVRRVRRHIRHVHRYLPVRGGPARERH